MHNRFHLKGSFWLELAFVGVLLIGSVLAMNGVVEDDEFAEMNSIFCESENSTNTYDGDLKDRQLMVPSSLEECPAAKLIINKTASKKSAGEGGEVEYIIEICNVGNVAVHNVEVSDVFQMSVDRGGVEFVSADPEPEPGFIWRFDSLPSGRCLNITLVLKVPESQELEFDMAQGVYGVGFVNVANDYSSTFKPYVIKNVVYVSSDETPTVTNCEVVTVVAGFDVDLTTEEYGSGTYVNEEQIHLKSENSSIKIDKDVSSTYGPTSLGLYNNRTAIYSSKWTEEACAKNRVTGASFSESYRYAASIDRESQMKLDGNGSVMEIDSEFEGMGHIGFLKKSASSSAIQRSPIFESREDYVGSFKVQEKIDEYSCSGEYQSINEHIYNVDSDKSVTGSGFVSEDKRIRDSQRTYEYGTGTYESEELIRTRTNYIVKDLRLVSAPVNQSLTDDFVLNQSMAWKEGIYSKTPETSYIGEEYSGASRLEKETVARGLNEMETEANFSGMARYRAVVEDLADIDEQYEGDYSLGMSILVEGIPKYDRPYMNVSKSATIYHVSEGTFAKYTINVKNDGNRALGPIYVRDVFPPESKFVGASVRPSELTESSAYWTLTHLSIGDSSTITLCLNVTDNHCRELVGFAEVSGGYSGDKWIMASCTSSVEVNMSKSYPEDPINATKAEALKGCDGSGISLCEELIPEWCSSP